jgi:hypothetical protein
MEGTVLRWFKRGEKEPPKNKRILVFSPEYKIGDNFRVRLIDSQFWKISEDAKYWAEIEEPGMFDENSDNFIVKL